MSESELYSLADHPEHAPYVEAAIEAMVEHLRDKGAGGVPFSHLIEVGVDAAVGDTSAREFGVVIPGVTNLFLAGGLPVWASVAWANLVRRFSSSIEIDYSETALMFYAYDGAPMLDLPRATTVRNYHRPRWLPTVISWDEEP